MDDEYDYERELEPEHDPDADDPSPPGDEDAPPEQPEEIRETVQEAIGYMVQKARKGPPLARAAPIPDPEQPRTPGRICAACGKPYAIRSFGECPHCQGQRNRRTGNALREVIRELKEGRANPERERHLVKQLHELGHPGTKGLLDSITAKREAPVRPRRGA